MDLIQQDEPILRTNMPELDSGQSLCWQDVCVIQAALSAKGVRRGIRRRA